MANSVANLGKLGHFFTEFLGSAAANVAVDAVKSQFAPSFLQGRSDQISTIIFGPSNDDERAFAEAIFVQIPIKAKALGKDYHQIVGKLLDLLSAMETELQDSFRQKTLQFQGTTDKDRKPDPEKTAEVLIGISQMDATQWKRFLKVYNLTPADMPFSPLKECERIEVELAYIRSQPSALSWAQRFNFFSLSHPSLKPPRQATSSGQGNRITRAWKALTQ